MSSASSVTGLGQLRRPCHSENPTDVPPSAQVGEMTLEDLITERLKAYQRELAQREAV